MSLLGKHLYRFGLFDLDAEQRVVYRESIRIPLPPKAFELLLYMVQNPLRLLTKEELLRAVWPDSFVEEGNLTQNIFLLRKALTAGQEGVRYIVTIPGRGYQFATAVEAIVHPPQNIAHLNGQGDVLLSSVPSTTPTVIHEESAASPAPPSSEAQPAKIPLPVLPQPPRSRQYAIAALLVLTLLAAGLLFWWKTHRPHATSQKIVLADFDNRTGDAAFDGVLKKALEIGLGQSPYMDVMSERETAGVLKRMDRNPDTPLTQDVATEICQRSNRQIMLKGAIANLGHDYLLTLQAFDCTSGKRLAETKAEAADKEKVLGALDAATDNLRHRLGESGQSVERFEIPVAQATTSSLEALKAYSIGEYMVGRSGKEETETLPMFQRAVELDPQFAMAYAAIATDYYNLSEYKLAAPNYQKAFDLSSQVSEKERLYIRAHYYADGQKDLEQGIREYKLWAETYPGDWGPWLNISNIYTQLGQYAPAIAAGEHALKLDPTRGINYSALARAYLRVNRFADAEATAQRAVAIKTGSYGIHATLFEIAFVEHNQAAMSREAAWSQGRPSAWFSLYIQGFAAATAGKYKQAEDLFHAAYSIAQRENLTETADDILIDQATSEFQLGQPAAARATLQRVNQQDTDNPDLIFLHAQLGDLPAAEHFLATQSSASHPGTLTTCVYLPRLRAELDLQHAKPLDAITALEPATPYQLAGGFTLPTELGEAYLKAGQPERAANEYKEILAHQGVDPVSPLFPLAHLQLARIEAKASHPAESRDEYEKLFAAWQDADKDLPILMAARREYAALTAKQGNLARPR